VSSVTAATLRKNLDKTTRAGVLLALLSGAPAAAQQTSLTYDAALSLAVARNLGLEAARRQRAIREAAIRTARQIPNPDVALQVFSVDVPVEIAGLRRRRIDLAREEATLAEVDVQAELRSVRRDLRRAFYALVAADERVRLAQEAVDIARRVRDAAQARFEAGAVPRLEVLQADLGVTRAETDLELARSTRVSSQASLAAVLNFPPDQPLAVSGTLADGAQTTITYERALALASASNPDLAALDRQMAIEERRLELARASRVPTPVFSVSSLFNDPEFDVGPRAAFTVGLPLFSRNQGEIAGSIAASAQLAARRAALRRDLENQVFAALARLDAQRRQVEAFARQLVPTAANLEALAEESYRAGRTSVLGVFEAQRNLRDIQRDALQASLDLQMALADLEELIGTPLP
jgi:cobalt-zinc-cadmium efflux system outer membrane protein